MKYYTLSVVVACIACLFSCGPSSTKSTPEEEKAFDLSSLPQAWVRLTQTDSGYIVYNTCDAGNLLLTVKKTDNSAALLLHGQQEDEEFDILKCYHGKKDTIVLRTQLKDSKESQDFKFVWKDKQKKLGQWMTIYPNGFASDFVFIPSDLQGHFPKINQPCRECWGEECDEIEE